MWRQRRPIVMARLAGSVRAGAVALVLAAIAAPGVPAIAAGPGSGSAERDWSARRLSRLVVPAADRARLADLPGSARIAWHPGTGEVRFLAGSPRRPLTGSGHGTDRGGAADRGGQANAAARGGRRLTRDAALRAARAFLREHGRLFGLARADRELRMATVVPADGTRGLLGPVVRLRQVRDGVPVLGGEAVVQLDPAGEVISVAGEFLPSRWRVKTTPGLRPERARIIAAEWLARESGTRRSSVVARVVGLAVHDSRLMGDEAGVRPAARLVWQVDAAVAGAVGGPGRERAPAHRLVLVDAHGGQVVTSISRVAHLDRRICDFRNEPRWAERCTAYTRREGQPQTGVADVDAAYRLMGVVDAFYRNVLGRDGLDGSGAPMVATVRYCPGWGCPLNNAYWRWHLQQATFGRSWTSDDIVGHEFTHGVLDHAARLFYHYQSGAINESFADVMGEIVDLRDPSGRDTSWTRWKIGEDSPLGVLRDMRDPPEYGDADRVRSRRWKSGPDDDGGVHSNSGVGNKAAYLVAVGDTFNGQAVAGIGLERTARIWYRAMTAHLTSASDYLDLGDALLQSCVDLAGTGGITLAHCGSVRAATRATEMHLRPRSGSPRRARVCASGRYPLDAFADDLEDPAAGLWRQVRLVGKARVWYYPPNPNNDPKWDGTWATSGELNLYGADRGRRTDAAMTLVPSVILPRGAYLWFAHGYEFDRGAARYDGGVVEVSLDGGPWRDVADLFTAGGYGGRLARSTGNPLAGRRAFTGRSRGYGSSRVDLSDFAGHGVRVRFRLATDRTGGGHGWYIDDVRIHRCARDTERPTVSVVMDEGAATTVSGEVRLAIEASDDASGVVRMLVSSSGATVDGRLAKGLAMAYRTTLDWSLTAAAWGGSSRTGMRRVFVQVRDAAGRWSEVASDEIELVPGG